MDARSGGVNHLNRPEGICFGPDGNLYLTSFRADATDNDNVRIYQGPGGASPGLFVDAIGLDVAGQPRAFAQALVFGPGGRLFVPINGNGPDTGSVRSYDVTTKKFDVFVQPAASGGPIGQPWYLTFGSFCGSAAVLAAAFAISSSACTSATMSWTCSLASATISRVFWPNLPAGTAVLTIDWKGRYRIEGACKVLSLCLIKNCLKIKFRP
jgi:hypothetical protein